MNNRFPIYINLPGWRLFGCAALLLFVLSAPAPGAEKSIIGWVEPVRIVNNGNELHFAAKIDTGADYSSIDFESLEVITRDNETWLRFQLEDDNGKTATLERPLHKKTLVKRKGAESQPRFVVMLELCLGEIRHITRFSLVDRHNYKYRLLIGRNFLRKRFVIDPSLKNTTPRICPSTDE